MVLISEKDVFAIELEMDEEDPGLFIWGHFYLWIRNRKFGDIKTPVRMLKEVDGVVQVVEDKNDLVEKYVYLIDMMMNLKHILKEKDNREDSRFYSLSKEEFFERVYGAYYTEEGEKKYGEEAQREKWERFDILMPGLNANEFFCLVDSAENSRVVIGVAAGDYLERMQMIESFDDYEPPSDFIVEEYILPKAYFYGVLEKAYEQINKWDDFLKNKRSEKQKNGTA